MTMQAKDSSSPSPPPTRRRRPKLMAPQDAIDDFWARFVSKTPGKATTVIPQNPYASRLAAGDKTHASFEEAAAMCRAKVEKVVKECRRVNKKYRDPHFDLETDLKLDIRDCLQSLSAFRDAKAPPGADFKPGGAKRVVDIFDKPQLYVDGPTANDVRQGRDGDCWLLAALCTLSNKKGLIERLLVAHDQHVGVYGFVFHRDGEWISEIVDDFLYLTKPDYDEAYHDRILFDELERANPEEAYRRIYQTNSSALYFASCQHPQETWLPLLEKCYAKAHGDYAAIEGGFGGEGIEDLTGGMTSEIFTTDILDREHFWKEELLKVNEDFLFGCSTGVWGIKQGERKGIFELHAYSIQKTVEVDGKRLLRLKNPWGKGEWKGAWSDGSKEWTPYWIKKLDHKFGDDGEFWIEYKDLLRKYQSFERTRLFGPEWRVSQVWTTLSIPWTVDYHGTHFVFSVSKPGPVVIVLSQLDDRYFRGLQGQYRFELAFRLHKAGHEDYLVRSQRPYRMTRSVNVELDLEAGEYQVRVKVTALRYNRLLPIDDVIRDNARSRRDKLLRIGLAYDLAHSKGKFVESPEEKATREGKEKSEKDKKKEAARKIILGGREQAHYVKKKQQQRDRKKLDQRKVAKSKTKGQNKDQSRTKIKTKEKDKANLQDEARRLLSLDGTSNEAATQKRDDDGNGNGNDNENNSSKGHRGILRDHSSDRGSSDKGDGESRPGLRRNNSVRFDRDTVSGSEIDDDDDDDDDDDLLGSIDSLSDLSERELDMQVEAYLSALDKPEVQQQSSKDDRDGEELDEFESDPWNASVVVGLRVYHKVGEEDKDKDKGSDLVKVGVVRPHLLAASDDEVEESERKGQGLDVDDSLKDATLEGSVKDRKASIVGDQAKGRWAT